MNSSQKRLIIIGFVIFILNALYLPYQHTFDGKVRKPAGYHLITNPPAPLKEHPTVGIRVDVNQFLIQASVLLIGFGALAYAFRKESD